jgi:endothelin-converting enzyme/putative endopeptidase
VQILTILSFAVCFTSLACAQTASSVLQGPPTELPKIAHFSPDIADTALDPCTDFYKYSCSKWHAANPIPSDEAAWGTGGPLGLWNQTILGQTLEKLSFNDSSRTANEQKIGDFYHSCMGEKTVDAHSKQWLQPELERIAGIKTKADFAAEIAHLHQIVPLAWAQKDNQTQAVLFGFAGSPDFDDASHNVAQFDQGGMSLPARSHYLDQDDKSKEIRAKYLTHLANMFQLIGERPDQAKSDADIVLEIETGLAQVAMDPISRRDPKNLNNKMSLAQVKRLIPSFDFDQYLKVVRAPRTPRYIETSPAFFKGMEAMLQRHSLEHWKVYLRWQVLSGSTPGLGNDFFQESFDFFGRTLVGAKEIQARWRRCVNATDFTLGEALGQAYVMRAFPAENRDRVLKLVQDLNTALASDIDSLDWMAAETKKQAQAKRRATLDKIGYPDRWRDYSSVQIVRDNYLANRQRANEFEFERWVAKIGQPVDRTEWTMTPPTVNAYEDPATNTINFPAGALQPPEFEMSQDDSVNYGAIGAIIGHETIHGFDDQGRKFDALGNLRDWWTAKDGNEYESRVKCISDQYSQEIPEAGPGVKQDGRMTLGEDTADNGGIYLAYRALQDALARQGRDMDTSGGDGLTPRQRFFLAFAFGWCTEYRPELVRLTVLSDPHSYPKYRVNNTVSNMPEFATAYGCHKGQPEARVNACRVW